MCVMYVCMCVMYVCMCVMYVCMCYVCLYVCCATPPGCFVSLAPNFQVFIYDPSQFCFRKFTLLLLTLSMNGQNTLCSYYVQLSTVVCEQLRTIVHNIMGFFYDCPKLRNTRASRY